MFLTLLKDPDGNIIINSVLSEETLKGQVLYEHTRTDPETGAPILVPSPVVVLRKRSLVRIPQPGEKWFVRIPIRPETGAPIEDFMLSPVSSPAGGGSIGFIKLHLQKVEQE